MKVFTDASYLNWGNPRIKRGSVSFFIPDLNIQWNEKLYVRDNNEAEYFAIYKALQAISKIKLKESVQIISDSLLCTFSLNHFINSGQLLENKYMTIQQKISELMYNFEVQIDFIHQKSHREFDGTTNWLGNCIADLLAKHNKTDEIQQNIKKYITMFNENNSPQQQILIPTGGGDAWD